VTFPEVFCVVGAVGPGLGAGIAQVSGRGRPRDAFFPEEFGMFRPILCALHAQRTNSRLVFRGEARFSRVFLSFRVAHGGEPVACRRGALAGEAKVCRATKRENRPFSRMFCQF
jgi:hypothetical protein